MNALQIYHDAEWALEHNKITLGEFDERIKPLADVEAVVRCKDCKYGQKCTNGKTTYQCFKWNSNEFGALHKQDWFCADGVKYG